MKVELKNLSWILCLMLLVLSSAHFAEGADNTPPTGEKIAINNNEPYTTNPSVRLSLSAEGATEMYIDGDVVDDAVTFEWIPYAESLNVQLTAGYIEKKLHVKFRDEAQNVSKTATASIIYTRVLTDSSDASDPTDDDEIYHPGQSINLTVIEAQKETGFEGNIQVKSQSVGYDSGMQKLKSSGNGAYTYIWNTAGLVESDDYTVEASLTNITGMTIHSVPLIIAIDNTPPTDVKISINNGQPDTALLSVTLTLSAKGAAEMFIDGDVVDDTNTYEWVPYSESLLVNLTGQDGTKEIRAKFRDAARNESDIATDTIRLNRNAPQAVRILIEGGKTHIIAQDVTLTIEATNATEMFIDGDVVNSSATFEWIPYASTKEVTLTIGDGEKRVRVKFRNASKIESETIEDTIILDSTPPVISSVTSQDADNTQDSDNYYHAGQSIRILVKTEEVETNLKSTVKIQSETLGYNSGTQTLKDEGNGTYSFLWDTTGLLEASDFRVEVKLVDVLNREVMDNSLSITIDNTPPQDGQLVINEGKSATASRSVRLSISAKDAAKMYIWGDIVKDSNTFRWIDFANAPFSKGGLGGLTDFVVNLTDGDGEKQVQVKFRDDALNESSPSSATILLDRQTPKELDVVINGGKKYTASNAVTLTLAAQNAVEMYIEGDVIATADTYRWIAFATSKKVTLSGDDGKKHVKVKFRNAGKIESEPVEATIILDSTPPAVQKVKSYDVDNPQDADNHYHASQRIEIRVEAKDSETGLKGSISIKSQNANYASGIQGLKDEGSGFYSYLWATDGLKEARDYRVEVNLKDASGRKAKDNSLTIRLDNSPPQNIQFSINDGQSSTASRSARLTVSADEAVEMYIEGDVVEDDNTFKWINFTPTLIVNLTDEDGAKKVQVRFRDAALNESRPVIASITLDRNPPKDLSVFIEDGRSYTDKRTALLTLSAKNAVEMYIEGDVIDDAETYQWIAYAQKKKVTLTQGDGEKRVSVKFRNFEKIESEPVEASIILDSEPPVISRISSQDATNSEDNDNYYHAGQQIKIQLETENGESGLSGDIRIISKRVNYDSGPQKLIDDGNGSYSFSWDTTGLKEASDYTAEASLQDGLKREVKAKPMTLIIDNTPPAGTISVNDGAPRTLYRSVTIAVEAQDAVEMNLSGDIVEDTNTFQWIPYADKMVVNLTDGAGKKVVTAKLRDKAGNESEEIEAAIIFSATPPEISNVESWDNDDSSDNDEYYSAGQIIKIVVLAASDEIGLLGTIRIKAGNINYDSGEQKLSDEGEGRYTYLWDTTGRIDGKYSVEAVLSDGIGHKAINRSLSITIDNIPPDIPSIQINESPKVKVDGKSSAVSPAKRQASVTVTASPSVSLTIATSATDAVEMYLDGDLLDDTNTFEWIPLTDTITVNLTADEGEKRISAKLRDAALNESKPAVKSIILDTTGPEGSMLINAGAQYAKEHAVQLSLKVDDAAEMYLSGDVIRADNTFGWIPYASEVSVVTTEEDGEKKVRAKFRDDLGNVGKEIEGAIILDTAPPKIESVASHNVANIEDDDGRYRIGDTIKIIPEVENEEAELKGTIRITSETTGYDSGIQRLEKDDEGVLSFLWETRRFLEAEDYQVEIKLQDAAENETVDKSLIMALAGASVPQSVTINSGDEYTELESVNLKIFSDNAAEMFIEGDIRDDSNSFEWIPYKPEMKVSLTSGDGQKTVKVKFRDKLERESDAVEDTIILDTEAPIITEVKSSDASDETDNDGKYHAGQEIKLVLIAAQAETGLKGTVKITSAQVGYDSGVQRLKDDGGGEYSYLWQTDGLKEADDYIVKATLTDLAGHKTTDSALSITIDNTPPVGETLTINKGATGTLTRSVTLDISAESSVQMWIEGDVVDDSNTFEWIPFASELVVNLTPGDGEKSIKVLHKDVAGNESRSAESKILLNELPPVIESVDSQDADNPEDSDEIYHAGQIIRILIKPAALEAGLEAMAQIKSEEVGYDSELQRASAETDAGEGDGAYVYLWDTTGLQSATDYIVNVTLQDELGQKSVDDSLTITIDNEPPTDETLTINNGEQATNERQVLLELSAKDAIELMIEGDVIEDVATFKWIPYLPAAHGTAQAGQVSKEVQLTEGDGKKSIAVKFRDEANNESAVVTASITLDATPPTNARIVINSGETETDSRSVSLNLLAEGATEMYIDGDIINDTNTFQWIPYQSSIINHQSTIQGIPYKQSLQVELTREDGKKLIGVKYRDDVGNESERVESSIVLDQPGPTSPKIVINNGEEYTNSSTVQLTLSAESATEMYIDGDVAIDNTFQWIPYQPNLEVKLIKSDGKKRVRVRFRNGVGNESEQVESNIILDQTPPVIDAVKSSDVNDPGDDDEIYHPGQIVSISATVEKNETGLNGIARIKSQQVKYDSGPQKMTDQGDGSYAYLWQTADLQDSDDYVVEITLTDPVEQAAVDNSLVITLDSDAPAEPKVIVKDEGKISLSRSVTLILTAQDAAEMFIEGDVINDTNTLQWTPYASEMVVNLAGSDGEKVIKVKFRDAARNESNSAEVKVTLELKKPRLLATSHLIQPTAAKITYLVLPFDEPMGSISEKDFSLNLKNPDNLNEQLDIDALFVTPAIDENKVVVQLTEEQVKTLNSWNRKSPQPPFTKGGIWVTIAENSAFDLAGKGNVSNFRNPSTAKLTHPALLQEAVAVPAEFSPNGDGVKDETVILYSLVQESNITIKIEDWRKQLIREWKETAQPKEVPHFVKWDGKKEDETDCPDGTYTISIEGKDPLTGVFVVAKTFTVILDNTPPQITNIKPLPGSQIVPQPEISVVAIDPSENQAASGIDESQVYLSFDFAEQPLPLRKDLPAPRTSRQAGTDVEGKYTVPPGQLTLKSGKHSATIHVADKAGNFVEQRAEYTVMTTEAPALLEFMNYPNPFKPGGSTTIRYVLSQSVRSAVISIYDAGGNLVWLNEMKGENLEAGEHRIPFNGEGSFGKLLSRGVYFCEFKIVTQNPGNTIKKLHKIAVW